MKRYLLPLALLLALAIPAGAVDFTQSILDLEGKPIHTSKEADSTVITYSMAVVGALSADTSDPRSGASMQSPIEKAQRYTLMQKIYNGKDVEITDEDALLIGKAVDAIWPPLIAGRVRDLIKRKK